MKKGLTLHRNARIDKGPKRVRRFLLKRADDQCPHMFLLRRDFLEVNCFLQSGHLAKQDKKTQMSAKNYVKMTFDTH